MIALVLLLAFCPPGAVEIDGGPAIFGVETPGQLWHEPRTERMLKSYCIDRYEYPNRRGTLPTVSLSWDEARQACAAEGKRLCTSDEWERACRGASGWHYSYGPDFNRSTCNTPIQGGGPEPGGAPYAPSGSHGGCRSPEGVFDLNGNVAEWVEDSWNLDRLGPAGGPGDDPTSLRQLRGGTMWDGTFYGQSCISRHAHPVQAQSDDDGFRCCANPQPLRAWVWSALFGVLVLGLGLGLGLWRRLTSPSRPRSSRP